MISNSNIALWTFGTLCLGLLVLSVYGWWRERKLQRRIRARIVGDRLLGGKPMEQSQAITQKRTVWDAVTEALLPHSFHPADPDDTRTFIRLDIRVRLSTPDRMRLLLTGDLRVLSTVYTDVEVRECRALTNIEVHPFTIHT